MSLLRPLAIPAFRNMFAAQALSLIGSGLATVALGLLAYDLAGDSAGTVLGIAMAIKMVSYVFISPVAAALAANLPRRSFLVGLDLGRAGLILFFPFVEEIWQVYLIIFLLFSLTAGFSPVFQATIPDIIKDEDTYVDALTLSRVSFNIEAIASPILAGIFLTIMTFSWLFVFTSIGFLASAFLVWKISSLARSKSIHSGSFTKRITSGLTIFRKTPRLRGLMSLNVVVALMGANVYINTIIVARKTLGGDDQTYLNLLLCFGVGSIAAALALRPLINLLSVRGLCLVSAFILSFAPVLIWFDQSEAMLYLLWGTLGLGMSLITTSSGLLLRSSANEQDRPSVFAAQFSLSHACWLGTYLLAAWLGREIGVVQTVFVTGGAALLFAVIAVLIWVRVGSKPLKHTHHDHSHEHWHIHDEHHHHAHIGDEGPEPHQHAHQHTRLEHSHEFLIDDHHFQWPRTRPS